MCDSNAAKTTIEKKRMMKMSISRVFLTKY